MAVGHWNSQYEHEQGTENIEAQARRQHATEFRNSHERPEHSYPDGHANDRCNLNASAAFPASGSAGKIGDIGAGEGRDDQPDDDAEGANEADQQGGCHAEEAGR